MNKPVTMVRKEFSEQLDSLVNNYLQYLPAFVVRPMIQNVDRQLEAIEKQQLEADEKEYNESLNSEPVEGEVVEN